MYETKTKEGDLVQLDYNIDKGHSNLYIKLEDEHDEISVSITGREAILEFIYQAAIYGDLIVDGQTLQISPPLSPEAQKALEMFRNYHDDQTLQIEHLNPIGKESWLRMARAELDKE